MSEVSDSPQEGSSSLRKRVSALVHSVLTVLATRFLIRGGSHGENESTRSLMRMVAFSFSHSFIVLVLFLSIIPLIGNKFSDRQQAAAQRVTLTSHQHALSQRIVTLANDLRQGEESMRGALLQALAEFEANHSALLALMAGDKPSFGVGPMISSSSQANWQRSQADLMRFIQSAYLLLEARNASQALSAWRIVHDLGHDTIYRDIGAAMDEAQRDFTIYLDWLRWGRLFVTILITMLSMCILALILRPLVARIREHADILDHQARIDALTGVLNRRALMEAGAVELQRAKRGGYELAVLLFDLDHFKSINDRFGHSVGDAVLKHFADVLQSKVRASDPYGRIGGEEFVLIAPGANLSAALGLAEKLRAAVAKSSGDLYPEITVSVGVAIAEPEETSLEQALARADLALYRAKNGGRNQVVSADIERAVPSDGGHPPESLAFQS